MRITVHPSVITGVVEANPSKSHAQRAIAIAALAEGTSTIRNAGSSADVRYATGVATALGAGISGDQDVLSIRGGGTMRNPTWHCGESGLCLRMFAAIAAMYPEEITLTAEGSLMNRPVDFIANALLALGVEVSADGSHPPIHIRGPYRERHAVIDASASSQLLTGLCIALPLVQHDTVIEVSKLSSRSYMIMTMETMKRFGVEAGFDGSMLEVTGSQRYRPAEVIVEGDWSGMANLLVAGSIAGDVVVNGLNYPSSQGDAVIVDILETCGAATTYDDAVTVQTLPLSAFDYDATDTPDLVPPLAVVAAYAAGTSRINGVHRLLHKESDRATALINEMTRLGIDIRVEGDALCISGSKVSGGNVDAHNDHRIAMALAVCALGADSPVTIEGADCVGKSYPDFFTHLAQLGARISMQS